MAGETGNLGTYVSDIASVERKVSVALLDTVEEVEHSECLDSEQRAEIYTILQTLKAETKAHEPLIEKLASRLK